MGAIADLTEDPKMVIDGNDSIVIRQCLSSIVGGRTLDMSGFPDKFVKAGHIVIYEKETDTWKPMPVKDGAYDALPQGHEYKGVVIATKPAARPMVGIMYRGEVNDKALPYPLTVTMRTALATALPHITFTHD